ncbi:hypothetical protein [Flavilitoribacter nigricans]|uniref:Effector-associated domain-containing protein n=1 Tax=Flavilitoribacter nigricans (strain ATCC 23147 / DSM 23189 / NBRC 102662 / NCIMB 1420 / SS-2) TaxID=1122177 RepID=A0A2D0N716_FLAN2|nr:hypothetical protein [Flavilitoribacter nigricans]PHN04304.1 hypothetical protein CRP01_22335 [Flavilitoribacter nigricans DSM 23189 = NBRC 102662]
MKEKLQNFIALGNTAEAIQQLRALKPALGESLQNEITLQSARFESYSRDRRNGVLSNEEENIQLARINDALLGIIQQLPAEIPGIPSRKTSAMKWGGIIVGAITLLAAIAELSGYSLRDLFQADTPPPIQQETHGNQSPAVIGDDTEINYNNNWGDEAEEEKADTTQKQ